LYGFNGFLLITSFSEDVICAPVSRLFILFSVSILCTDLAVIKVFIEPLQNVNYASIYNEFASSRFSRTGTIYSAFLKDAEDRKRSMKRNVFMKGCPHGLIEDNRN
jgi:hypothetical protein